MPSRALILVVLLASAVACGRSAVSPTPAPSMAVSPAASSPGSIESTGTTAVKGRQEVLVNMQDACDPTTFDAAVGAGTCVRSGGVKFDQFIAELTRHGFIGPWHFAPPNANVQVGQEFVAVNKGGEVHTFTEVAQFGGGIVASLNELAHVPAVAPECAALEPDDFVAPGGTYHEDVDHAGALKFQCCIHPWMRLEARSTSR